MSRPVGRPAASSRIAGNAWSGQAGGGGRPTTVSRHRGVVGATRERGQGEMSVELADRDQAVLASIDQLRLVTTAQLERLHFTGHASPAAAARATRRTMLRLERAGLVVRLERRVGGVRAGSAGLVWSLGTHGQRLASSHGPAGGRTLRRPWTPSLPFVAHRLATVERYVELVEAARGGDFEVVSFAAEPACWRPFTGIGGEVVTLKPDAVAVVARGDYEYASFIETDMATQSPAVIGRKCSVYASYWRSGREQAIHDVFPRVVFVAPTSARVAVLAGVIGRRPHEERQLFMAVTTGDAVAVLSGGAS